MDEKIKAIQHSAKGSMSCLSESMEVIQKIIRLGHPPPHRRTAMPPPGRGLGHLALRPAPR